eukprot:TRINITY_DN2319_c0_g1_i1.p1 TRINITY_DN2319_c0_g1~~TRINITY_DN2319_c0_g1_i1.p1  ORF type:complete len:638 (+),score=66.82 TRINITY_DN2319_c0_g1_i1:15-1928(+)
MNTLFSIVSNTFENEHFNSFLRYILNIYNVPINKKNQLLKIVENNIWFESFLDIEILYLLSNGKQPMYTHKSADKNLDKIKNILPIIGDVSTILDIGTENSYFLDKLETLFNTKQVYGLNIDEGFCHYNKDIHTDRRIKLYDGLHISEVFERKFDLITLFAVVHHITTIDLRHLAIELVKVSKGYVFIKDNDLTTNGRTSAFLLQHMAWEMKSIEDISYTNDSVTMNTTIKIFESVGFESVWTEYHNEPWNFNGTYYMLFKLRTITYVRNIKNICDDILTSINRIENYVECITNVMYKNRYHYVDELFDKTYIYNLFKKYSLSHKIFKTKKPNNFKLRRVDKIEKYYRIGFNSIQERCIFGDKYILKTQSMDTYSILTDFFVERVRYESRKKYVKKSIKEFIKSKKYIRNLKLKNKNPYHILSKQGKLLSRFNMNICRTYPISIATTIYKMFGGNMKILDICAGWGDRMISAMMLEADCYTGIDPNTNLSLIYPKIVECMQKDKSKYKVINAAFEDVPIEDLENDYDIMFTSPPYFNIELYSDDINQIANRYKTIQEWIDGFVHPSIDKIYSCLKQNGYMILDIGEISTGKGEHSNYLFDWFDYACNNMFKYKGSIPYEYKMVDLHFFQNLWIFEKV